MASFASFVVTVFLFGFSSSGTQQILEQIGNYPYYVSYFGLDFRNYAKRTETASICTRAGMTDALTESQLQELFSICGNHNNITAIYDGCWWVKPGDVATDENNVYPLLRTNYFNSCLLVNYTGRLVRGVICTPIAAAGETTQLPTNGTQTLYPSNESAIFQVRLATLFFHKVLAVLIVFFTSSPCNY